jgi:hypothetical protein
MLVAVEAELTPEELLAQVVQAAEEMQPPEEQLMQGQMELQIQEEVVAAVALQHLL